MRGQAQQSAYDIALIRNDHDKPLGYHHVACEIANEDTLEESRKNLADAGIEACFEINDSRKLSFFLQDPDRLLVEFYVERTTDYAALADIDSNNRAFFA